MKVFLLCLAALLTGCASRPECFVPVTTPMGYAASVLSCIVVDKAVDAARKDE